MENKQIKKIFFSSLAGISEAAIMQPVDTIKVLRQSNQFSSEVFKKPLSLYKGLSPFMFQMSIKYFLRFGSFETFKGNNNNKIRHFGAGVAAGITESLFITPFELIKTNLQTTNNKHPIKIIKEIHKEKGFKGLYRGFSATCFRQSINQGFNFSIYHHLKDKFLTNDKKPSIIKIALSSLISSSIGPIITNPFDVIKTRYMNPKYKYNSMLEACKDIIKNDGFRFFFKGLSLRLFRVCGGQIITFNIIENLMYYTD